jgi:two-component system, chemotaxis family, chemotaxis protein CheY
MAHSILLVDDDSAIRLCLDDCLRDAGYVVTLARNAAEALLRVCQERPSVMLVDMLMPGMDGRALIEACRRLPGCGQIPTVLMSASSPATGELDKLAVEGFVAKPFDLTGLLEVIDRAVRKPRTLTHVVGEEAVQLGAA